MKEQSQLILKFLAFIANRSIEVYSVSRTSGYLCLRLLLSLCCIRHYTPYPHPSFCSTLKAIFVLLIVSAIGMLLKGRSLCRTLEILEADFAFDRLGCGVLYHAPIQVSRSLAITVILHF